MHTIGPLADSGTHECGNGAIELGKVIGPVRDADHQEEIILDLMRENSELAVQSGADAVFSVDIGEEGRPVINSFSAAYLDGLRERVWMEHPEKWEP